MKILKRIIIGLAVLFALLMAIGLLLPSAYKVERSVTIQAPVELVFDQVNDLRKNEAWSPWKDPTMVVKYSEPSAGKGASSSWTSKDMGNGTQTIEESVPNSTIDIHLDFGGMGTAKAKWLFSQEGEAVKVTQQMYGDQGMNPVKRYMNLMMDKMVGPYFEKGLASLKQVSETKAAALKEAPAAPADSAAATAGGAAAAPAAGTPADSGAAKAAAPAAPAAPAGPK